MADEPQDTQTEVASSTVVAPPVSPTPPEALRLGLPDGPEAQPGKPFEKGKGSATVRTRWPIDSFESGLKGVPVITAHGVEVDRSNAEKLNELAALNGIELEEVE